VDARASSQVLSKRINLVQLQPLFSFKTGPLQLRPQSLRSSSFCQRFFRLLLEPDNMITIPYACDNEKSISKTHHPKKQNYVNVIISAKGNAQFPPVFFNVSDILQYKKMFK